MHRQIILLMIVITLSFVTGCSNETTIDFGNALSEAAKDMEQHEGVESAVYAYNNDDNNINLRIMVDESLTQQQAETYIEEYLNKISLHSNEDVWKYYFASFDIKSYEDGILFEGTKKIDEGISLTKK